MLAVCAFITLFGACFIRESLRYSGSTFVQVPLLHLREALRDRGALFAADVDGVDPWQFKNIRV